MDLWMAVVLGLVEGLTEFLPVSSTGHLIVAGELLGSSGDSTSTFKIFIQMGAMLAVVVFEWPRFAGLLRADPARAFSGPRGVGLLALTTMPALLAGAALHGVIKERLFGPVPVAVGLFAGGLMILAAERFHPPARTGEVDGLGWRQALVIGLFQCLAMWPGVSRAGATIVGGLMCGVERRSAAVYSFLAAVPVLTAATAFDLYKSLGSLGASDVAPFAVGFVVSFLAAWAAIRSFVALLGRHTLVPFAWYRLAIAPAIFWFVA